MSPAKDRSGSSRPSTVTRGSREPERAKDENAADPATRASRSKAVGTGTHGDGARRQPTSMRTIVDEARAQLHQLTGRSVEAVTSVERTDDGWCLDIEVVELDRIPASTSILGSYEVRVDNDGNLVEYARTTRYHRNQAGESE